MKYVGTPQVSRYLIHNEWVSDCFFSRCFFRDLEVNDTAGKFNRASKSEKNQQDCTFKTTTSFRGIKIHNGKSDVELR